MVTISITAEGYEAITGPRFQAGCACDPSSTDRHGKQTRLPATLLQ
jgi:hypothetical protein